MTILESILPSFVNNFLAWLNIPIYTSSIVEFQFGWGVVHLILAFLLIYILIKYEFKNPLFLAFILLVSFEVFEFIISHAVPIINMEIIQDTIGDLVIGFFSVVVGYFVLTE